MFTSFLWCKIVIFPFPYFIKSESLSLIFTSQKQLNSRNVKTNRGVSKYLCAEASGSISRLCRSNIPQFPHWLCHLYVDLATANYHCGFLMAFSSLFLFYISSQNYATSNICPFSLFVYFFIIYFLKHLLFQCVSRDIYYLFYNPKTLLITMLLILFQRW
jgi:hypothetical protein